MPELEGWFKFRERFPLTIEQDYLKMVEVEMEEGGTERKRLPAADAHDRLWRWATEEVRWSEMLIRNRGLAYFASTYRRTRVWATFVALDQQGRGLRGGSGKTE